MTLRESVLGCAGLCWVGFANPTQRRASIGAGSGCVCWVCWVFTCARACVNDECSVWRMVFFLYARTEKPDKPNTLNTEGLKALICLGFLCVGFVLGLAVLCWVGFSTGEYGR